MNRGSYVYSAIAYAITPSFNEAPIHESGKSRLLQTEIGPPVGFNEAPIHESGKSGTGPSASTSSTGFNEAPIHESGKSSQTATIALNRCARFNEAPIHESGKSGQAPLGEGPVARASMRPRFMNRGSADAILWACTQTPASMRPRFMNRGSSVGPWGRARANPALQ